MALIYCRECGKQISSAAGNCPYCGYPLKGEATKQGDMNWGYFFVSFMIPFVGIILCLVSSDEKSKVRSAMWGIIWSIITMTIIYIAILSYI